VLLLARKNPDLHDIMKDFVDGIRAEKEAAAAAAAGAGGGGGAKKSKGKK
jgi:hypothetical protein